MREDIDFFVNSNIGCGAFDIFIRHNGAWVINMGCRQIADGEIPPQAMRISGSQAQQLMDQLYKAGIRPTEHKDSEPAMAALQQHLEDMRAIAFSFLSVEKP